FLVSAGRRGGKTRWVRIKSLAGEPCRVRPGFEGTFDVAPSSVGSKEVGAGVFELGIGKGQEAILFQEAGDVLPEVTPCVLSPKALNAFGLKDPKRGLSPALSSGKQARASTEWGSGYRAAQAVDDDPATRWGAAPESRGGWLEVDLGAERRVGGVEIWEIGFARVRAFTVEVRQGESWLEVARGTAVKGRKKISFAPVTARQVRLVIHEASEVPTLEEFRVLAPE
ncbi:MAG: discoidin domain-containing protein, partial [Clostridiales bacterium]|nr:discoidin domain-containing protein [Clostridiales bacterium]